MAKTTFVDGSELTPAFLNALNNPIFVTSADDDGEIPKITDADLSDTAGQIKSAWYAFRDELKVTAGTGLSVNYAAGTVTVPSGTTTPTTTIAAGTLGSLTNDATSYIFVNSSGAVAASTVYPTIALMLASVTTVSGSVTSITDLRPRFRVLPVGSAIRVFGGASPTDKTCTNGETLNRGVYFFRDFTVGSGVSITISYAATIYCSGNVNIAGTINVTPMGFGAAGFAFTLSSGGSANGNQASGLGSRTAAYPWGAQLFGTGGAGGSGLALGTPALGAIGTAGDGGGYIQIIAAGTVTVSGVINASGGNATAPTIGQSITPGTVDNAQRMSISGSGGGSGGQVQIQSLRSIVVTGSILVKGGNGSNALLAYGGLTVNTYGTGGGGGGGGYLVCLAPSINTTGADIQLTAGSKGTDVQYPGSATFSSNVYTLATANSLVSGGYGGAFGGRAGYYEYTTSTSVNYYPAANGQFFSNTVDLPNG